MSKTKRQLLDSLDSFTKGYLECMFWCTSPLTVPAGQPEDSSLDRLGYRWEDLDKASLQRIIADCSDFQTSHDNPALLAQWYALGRNEAYSGHDFWLTRNGHGAGFWGRYPRGTPAGDLGDRLSVIARSYGEVNLDVWRGKVCMI